MQINKILNPLEEVLTILSGRSIDYFPRSILLNSPTVDMMKSCNTYWPEAHFHADEMATLACAIHTTTGFNAVNLPWDACVELEALGGDSSIGHSIIDVPQPTKPAFNGLDKVTIPRSLFTKGRFPRIFRAVQLAKEKLPDGIPVVPLVEGPLNLACICVGSGTIYRMVIKERTKIERILHIFAGICVEYGNRLLESGGDIIQLSDPFSQGLNGKHFNELMNPIYKIISEKIKGPSFLHICGNTGKFLDYLPASGFSAFSFDSPAVSSAEVTKRLAKSMRIIGSIPTVSHILNGKEEDVFNVSLECIRDGVDILSPSCGLPPESPLKNLRAMVKAIQYHNEISHGIVS